MEQQNFIYEYPHPAVACDCAVFGFDGHDIVILLIRRGIEPYKDKWALPGGFLRMDETAEQCVRRELCEETTLSPEVVEHFGVFSAVGRDPRERVLSVSYFSLVRKSEVRGGDDASDAQWFSLSSLPGLAFDHEEILAKALQTLRERIYFEPIGFGLMDRMFTIPELQRLYEAILGVSFDRRNFLKKILLSGIIAEVPDEHQRRTKKKSVGRTPKYYTFDSGAYEKMKGDGVGKIEF